ncbi:hypothetical protein GCM10023063_16470 [Arthrobacter methylotrophus]
MSDFTVTSTITFRPHRIPPRCRKPRPVQETFTHEFPVPCVSSADAPMVALVPDDRGYYGTMTRDEAPLRAHAGKLYVAEMRGRLPVMAGSGAFPSTDSHESWSAWEYEAIEEAGKRFKDILIVDGEVWKATPEPAYAIVTMGLGGNHGGTYLEIDYAGRYSRRYTLTDYDAAVEAAVSFAIKRGDTNTIGVIRKTPKATILDPSVFKIPSETDALAAARAEIRTLAAQARDILYGTLTRASLTEARDLAEKAASVFWQHDLEEFDAE